MKNRFVAWLLCLVMLLSVSAVAAAEVNPNQGLGYYPGTSTKGSIAVECSTMSVMNPIKMTYNTELGIARHTQEHLVRLSPVDNQIVPGAAESWTSSPDGLTWTFNLRKDMKWVNSKGEVVGDVTAHDYVFGWRELLNPANAAEYYAYAAVFKNGQAYYDYASGVPGAPEVSIEDVAIKAVDDYTLVCELENVLPYFLQYVKFEVMAPIYEPFYTEVGADVYGTSPDTMLYCGPFYMSDWVLENKITTPKNEHWYDAANVSLGQIEWIKYTDTNAKMNAFQGGEVDLIDVTGEQREMFAAEGFTVSNYVGGYSFYLYCAIDNDRDISNLNLRKAISYALDREQLINTVFKNDSEPSPTFALGIAGVNTETFSEAVLAANGGERLYPANSDEAKAQEYFAKALEELGKTADQIDITFMVSEGTQNELYNQVMQEQLRKVLGIEAKIEVLTITEARARRNAHDYDLFAGGWGPDYNDPMTDLDLWTTTNGNNHTGYSSKKYDALIELAKVETDMVEREQIFVKCEKLIAEDMPIIPIYWRHEDYVVSEKMAEGYARLPFQSYNLIYTKLAE
ncbi:MAG: peptide ABC transporter substrate-binding protein [Clostridiales bacterium]|nr:peptide ABC transporter substrate-binding protein [Clostridiales bacterium]